MADREAGKKKMSRELRDSLAEFLFTDIGQKAKAGISYNLVLNSDTNKEPYERGMRIREEANKCGFEPNELFMVYKMSNGYLFDMDLEVTRRLTMEISKAVAATNGNRTPAGDLLAEYPTKKRNAEIQRLAKECKAEFSKGKKTLEVALFSRNKVPKIVVSSKDRNGEALVFTYDAYIIRHTDLNEVNRILKEGYGLQINYIENCEILPSKTGVRFKLHISKA